MTFSPGWHELALTTLTYQEPCFLSSEDLLLSWKRAVALLLRTWRREFLFPHLYLQHFFSIMKAGVWTWNEISLFLTIYHLQSLLVLRALFSSVSYQSHILLMSMTFLPSFLPFILSFILKLLHPLIVFYQPPSSTSVPSQLACSVDYLWSSICPSLLLLCASIVGHHIFSYYLSYHLYADDT